MSRNTAPLEFRRLTPDLLPALERFFHDLVDARDDVSFHPHPFTAERAGTICSYDGRDLYYAAVRDQTMLAYGMLRGWDEGYAIPSLGIALHASARGTGLAATFMSFLHTAAGLSGAQQVRLTVYKNNVRAVALYRRLGYQLAAKNDHEWVGVVTLADVRTRAAISQ